MCILASSPTPSLVPGTRIIFAASQSWFAAQEAQGKVPVHSTLAE